MVKRLLVLFVSMLVLSVVVTTAICMTGPSVKYEELQTVEAEFVSCAASQDESRFDKVIFEGLDIVLSDGNTYRYEDSETYEYHYQEEFEAAVPAGASVVLRHRPIEKRGYMKVYELVADGQEVIGFETVRADEIGLRRELAFILGVVVPALLTVICAGIIIHDCVKEKRGRPRYATHDVKLS